MKNNLVKSIVILTSICLIVALLLSGVNEFTAPVISEAEKKAADGALLEVLPNATEFEAVTGEFPATVTEMKKDLGGSGFAFKLSTTSSYSQSPLTMILGIDNEGKITKLSIINYAETKGTAADFEPLFEGKDATMSDVVAGVTYTTNAIKGAVKDAYDVFYQYADIEKSDEQKLQDLYSTVLPGGADKTGAYSLTSIESDGAPESITGIYAPTTKIGYVITGKSGDTTVVMGVNAYGKVSSIYDLDGNNLANDTAYDQIKADAESVLPSIYEANNDEIIQKMIKTGIIDSKNAAKKVDFGAINSRVVAVYKVTDGYAYIAKAEGYGGVLEVCYVINTNGEIVKYATLEQHEVAEEEYGMYFGTVIKNQDYADRFNGLTTNTVTDDTLIIAGSTFTTNATKLCWNDIKAASEIINGEAKN